MSFFAAPCAAEDTSASRRESSLVMMGAENEYASPGARSRVMKISDEVLKYGTSAMGVVRFCMRSMEKSVLALFAFIEMETG